MTKAIKMLLDPKVSYSLLAILVAPVVAAAQPVDTTVTKVTVAAAKTVNLTNKADKYTNRANGVTVNGLKGDDRIINEEGHDVKLFGGPGNDILINRDYRAGYNSRVFGGPGNDRIFCDGSCAVHGDDGDDYLSVTTVALHDNDASLWGGIGRNTFNINITSISSDIYYDIYVIDAKPTDHFKVRLANLNGVTGSFTLADAFDKYDTYRDGVIDQNDTFVNVRGWDIGINYGNGGSNPSIAFYNNDANVSVLIQGVNRLTRAQVLK